VKVTDDGVPVEELIRVVKDSVQAAGASRASQTRDLQVTSVRLILEVVASTTAGGRLDFRVPVIGMKLRLGATVTRKDTHTIDVTLVPKQERPVRGGDIEEVLVSAIETIRRVVTSAAAGRDPWVLSESTIDISFAITGTGTISLGAEGELASEVTQTLRLGLGPGPG
jgi:hypothetical protein